MVGGYIFELKLERFGFLWILELGEVDWFGVADHLVILADQFEIKDTYFFTRITN